MSLLASILPVVKMQTLIFDLDGTISDPFEGLSKSVNFALESLGYKTVDVESVRTMIGPPLTDLFATFVGSVTSERMQALVDKYRERYAKVGYTENVIYEGIPDIIATLSAAGYTLGVCTSKRADYATAIVDMFGLTEYFAFVDGGDINITKSQQLERLVSNGIDASTAVMIGDRNVDIEAGKSNGLKSVGVTWGFGDLDELELAAPDQLIRSPNELLELFP